MMMTEVNIIYCKFIAMQKYGMYKTLLSISRPISLAMKYYSVWHVAFVMTRVTYIPLAASEALTATPNHQFAVACLINSSLLHA